MSGFFDLHCHWVANIDDGVRSDADGVALLQGLARLGFSTVVATPHMRPGMFDNDRAALEQAFARMHEALALAPGVPEVHLASEHFFDDIVFDRLVKGEGLPYPRLDGGCSHGGSSISGPPTAPAPAKHSVLIELHPQQFPARLQSRLFDLGRAGLRPVIAHPERYQPVWRDDACLDPLLDAGAALLLDLCALVGKYGRAAQRAAEKLLDDDAYEAACTDAHRPADVDEVANAIERLRKMAGAEETTRLLRDGPRALLGLART